MHLVFLSSLFLFGMLASWTTTTAAFGLAAVSSFRSRLAHYSCCMTKTTTMRRTQQQLLRLSASASSSSTTTTTFQDLTEPEQRVYSLVEQLHRSEYAFRVVVVGNGAILETTTAVLGPIMKLNTSPQTGNALLTLASQDQAFEFHIQLSQVSKIALTLKESTTTKDSNKNQVLLRVIRFLSNVGAPMCSLILRDESDEAIAWYDELREMYGEDIQL